MRHLPRHRRPLAARRLRRPRHARARSLHARDHRRAALRVFGAAHALAEPLPEPRRSGRARGMRQPPIAHRARVLWPHALLDARARRAGAGPRAARGGDRGAVRARAAEAQSFV
eukprot:4256307-Prymnesium_polylepis.1